MIIKIHFTLTYVTYDIYFYKITIFSKTIVRMVSGIVLNLQISLILGLMETFEFSNSAFNLLQCVVLLDIQ